MGFRVNRRISLGKNVRVNIGKRGVSTSVKMGPVTVNSRGRKTVHVAKGVSYTINPKTKRNTAPQRRSTVESNQQASYTPSSAGSTPHQPRPKTLKQLEIQYKAYNVLLWVMYALTAFTILMCLLRPRHAHLRHPVHADVNRLHQAQDTTQETARRETSRRRVSEGHRHGATDE